MTHYSTLGVSETATPDEIKKAYRSLASKHHPDKGGDTQKFQEIQAAYAVLEDANKRAQYDAERTGQGRNQFTWNTHSDVDINDLFRHFNFGGDPFAQFRQHQQPRRNKDLRIDISIPLVQTLQDNVKTISVQTTNGNRRGNIANNIRSKNSFSEHTCWYTTWCEISNTQPRPISNEH